MQAFYFQSSFSNVSTTTCAFSLFYWQRTLNIAWSDGAQIHKAGGRAAGLPLESPLSTPHLLVPPCVGGFFIPIFPAAQGREDALDTQRQAQ